MHDTIARMCENRIHLLSLTDSALRFTSRPAEPATPPVFTFYSDSREPRLERRYVPPHPDLQACCKEPIKIQIPQTVILSQNARKRTQTPIAVGSCSGGRVSGRVDTPANSNTLSLR